MSNRRKRRRPNRKALARRQRLRLRQARSARRPRKPRSPHALGPDASRMIWLSMALGTGMAHKAVEILDRYWDRLKIEGVNTDGTVNITFHFPEPDGTVLAMILDMARDVRVVSNSADPDERTWDAITQLRKLDAMVTQPAAAA
jgi:hypothetical protein